MKRCYDTWHGSVSSGQPYHIEYRFWDRQENRWRWFMGRALPVRGRDGSIVKWFGTATDIDDQKRVEEELRRANQDLEQFAYSASHDLQEPLRRSIEDFYAELLTERYGDKLDGQAFEFLDYLHTGAMRMENLVGDLLAYTQVTRIEAPAEVADVNEALDRRPGQSRWRCDRERRVRDQRSIAIRARPRHPSAAVVSESDRQRD